MNEKLVNGVAIAVIVGLLGWGAWVTLGVADAASEEELQEHKDDNVNKFESVQRRIEDKIDELQKILIDNLGKENRDED